MQLSISEAERLARAGAEALRAGRVDEAKLSFEQITASGRANAQIWLLLAHSARLVADWATTEKAADEVLRIDAANLRALVLKGDARLGAGDDRGAGSFYGHAVKLAERFGTLPPELSSEIQRAEAANKELSGRFRAQLEKHLNESGFAGAAPTARFRESIDILLEEKQVYFQQPTAYFFPGLPQIQFYERSSFPWAEAVESAADDMRAELEAVADEDGLFRPYLQAREDRPSYDFHGLLDNPAWSTLYLWENGGPVERNVARFPRTFEALRDLPLPHITTRAPSILFSLLKPGARIAPHNGMINTRLICHLPLIVPPKCGFRVGNEVRAWEPGKLLIFDDTIEHEAWNDSDEDRVIVIFDVWRPELEEAERRAVTAIFEAIDGYDEAAAAGSA